MLGLPSPLDNPTLRSDLPTYPPLPDILRVTPTTVSGPSGFGSSSALGPVLYVAFVCQLRTDTLLPRDRVPCLANDLNGAGLGPGYYTGARLSGSYNGLPIYSIGAAGTPTGGLSAGGAGGGPAVPTSSAPGGGPYGPPVLGGMAQNQYLQLVLNLSPSQLNTLSNLNYCQQQVFTGLTVPKQQTITGALTPTQVSTLVGVLNVGQLQGLVSNLNVPQLQKLTTALTPEQIRLFVQTLTPVQMSKALTDLSTAQLQALVATIGNATGYVPVADVNYVASSSDRTVAYTSITAARRVTLPTASSVPAGTPITLRDASGSASASLTISARPAGTDKINGSTSDATEVSSAYGEVQLVSNGVDGWTSPSSTSSGASSVGVTTYTSGSGTWTKGASTKFMRVTVVGGGAGGGGVTGVPGATSSGGGGGGGGGCAVYEGPASDFGSTETYSVGGGGTGGAFAAGNGGTQSTFTRSGHGTITGSGGNGGNGNVDAGTTSIIAGGTGGAATNGTYNVQGGSGRSGLNWVIAGTATALGGHGGASGLGYGGANNETINAGTGAAGNSYGGGGAGAADNAATNRAGGAGATGIIIVEEWS